MIKFYLFTIIAIFILFIGIQTLLKEGSSDNYLNYTNHNNAFTMKYPVEWSLDDNEYVCQESPTTINIITLLPDGNEATNINNRILFFIDDIQKNVSNFGLNEYAFQRLNFFKDFGNIIQFDTNSKLRNETAYTVVLEQNPNTSSIDNNITSSSIIIGEIGSLLDSKIYRIIYTIEKLQYDNFLPVLNQIINSFTTNITDIQKNNETALPWNSYNLKNGNNKYSINYNMIGLGNSLTEIKPLVSQAELLFKVDAPNDGFLVVEIPRKLLDSKLQNNTDYKFHITNDNKPNTPYEEISSNSNYRVLKIEINDEDRVILIGGSKIDTGRTTSINCNDIIFSPIKIVEEKEEKTLTHNTTIPFNIKNKEIGMNATSESLNEVVELVNESTINSNDTNISNILNAPSVEKEITEETLKTVEKATAGISEITESLNNASELIEVSTQNPNDFKGFFPLEVDGKNYTIEISSANTNKIFVKKIEFDNNEHVAVDRLFVYVDSPTTEKFQISIPRELLDSTKNGKDVPFDVLMDTFFKITTDEVKINNQTRILSIPITNETNLITILGNKDKKTIDQTTVVENKEEKQDQQIVSEKPNESKRVSVNVFLDTHIYTLFDQSVSVKLYNSNGQIDAKYLSVPDTGGAIVSFNVDESNIPDGTISTVCVTNQGNYKEDCQTVNRGYGDDNINVRMIVP